MNSLYLLIPLAVVLVALAIWALFWAVKSGQYDDLDTESRRILFDNEDRPTAGNRAPQERKDGQGPDQ